MLLSALQKKSWTNNVKEVHTTYRRTHERLQEAYAKKKLFKRPGEAARTMLQYSGETDRVREREREIVRM